MTSRAAFGCLLNRQHTNQVNEVRQWFNLWRHMRKAQYVTPITMCSIANATFSAHCDRRHVLIDLRHGRWDTDTVEITMFVNFLEGTLLPNLDKCTGRLVVLMHTIERDKEPENYRVFKELLRIDQENGRFELVDDIESGLRLFAKQTTHEPSQRSSSVVQPMAAYA